MNLKNELGYSNIKSLSKNWYKKFLNNSNVEKDNTIIVGWKVKVDWTRDDKSLPKGIKTFVQFFDKESFFEELEINDLDTLIVDLLTDSYNCQIKDYKLYGFDIVEL